MRPVPTTNTQPVAAPAVAAPPDYAQQAQTDLAPIYQSLVDQLNESRAAGERGIAGYTHSFANMLGGYNPQAGYNSAAQAQAALDAALQQSLTGTGQDLSQGLAGQLAQINAPGETSSRVIGGINQAATGAANAGLAKGSASLSALLAQGAAAGQYAAGLPGYAAGLGLQQTRLLEGDTQQQIGQALANEPRDVLSRADALQSAATTAQNRKEDLAYRNQQAQATDLYRRAQLGLATKKDAYNEWLQSKKLGLAQDNQTFNQWAKQQGLAISGAKLKIAQANATGGGVSTGKLSIAPASTKARYLQSLWIQAGGNPQLAPTMAAIALAESGGNPNATNPTDNNGKQTSWGLWQISRGDHAAPSAKWNNPLENARLAVAKFGSQGLGAWGTYSSGAYKQYLGTAEAAAGQKNAATAKPQSKQSQYQSGLSSKNYHETYGNALQVAHMYAAGGTVSAPKNPGSILGAKVTGDNTTGYTITFGKYDWRTPFQQMIREGVPPTVAFRALKDAHYPGVPAKWPKSGRP